MTFTFDAPIYVGSQPLFVRTTVDDSGTAPIVTLCEIYGEIAPLWLAEAIERDILSCGHTALHYGLARAKNRETRDAA